MQKLIEQQQILERRRSRNNLALNTHAYVFPSVGILLMTAFYDINNTLALIGCVITLYCTTGGVFLVIPRYISDNYDIEKELKQLSKNLEHIKLINRCLDDRRDQMLFDDDVVYWQLLEELETKD